MPSPSPQSPPPGSTKASRLALPLLAFIFGAVGLLMAIGVVFMPKESDRSPTASIGGPFKMVDQDGKPFTDKAMLGKPTLVFFGFTHCPDVCPTTLYEITQVYDALGPKAAGVRSLFVTVDPERDTPALLKTYLSSFDPNITGLTGDRAAVDGMLKAYRVFARKVPGQNGDYTMDHTALVYLMDKNGKFVGAFNLQRTPADSAKELERFL